MASQEEIDHNIQLLWSEHGDRRNGIQWLGRQPEARLQVRAILEGRVELWAGPAAIEVLGLLGDARDVPFLDSLLLNPDYETMYFDIGVALGRHRSPEAFELLKLRVDHAEEKVASAAILGLGESGHAEARSLLESKLSHEDERIRFRAVHAIGELGVEGSAVVLKERLKVEPEADVKDKIKEVLARK